jgi:hypothetical protein
MATKDVLTEAKAKAGMDAASNARAVYRRRALRTLGLSGGLGV